MNELVLLGIVDNNQCLYSVFQNLYVGSICMSNQLIVTEFAVANNITHFCISNYVPKYIIYVVMFKYKAFALDYVHWRF